MVTARVMANSRNSFGPTTSPMNSRGMSTAMSEMVSEMMSESDHPLPRTT